MKILVVHNHYQQYGGEDAVVKLECALHREHGHEIYLYERSNQEIDKLSWAQKAGRALNLHWSRSVFDEIGEIIQSFRPDIAHIYNTHFMITPSVYDACRDAGVPVVQSLYNFRLVCANALLLRNNRHCEECLHHSRWRSVWYKCYRHSSILTACVVKAQEIHWRKGTWKTKVNAYIVANEYSREKFVQAGIPREKFFIKPHFVHPDPTARKETGDYALYVGRLSVEKGVKLLLTAWENLPEIPLKVLGTGPLLDELKEHVKSKRMDHIEVLGYRPDAEFFQYLSRAKFLVVPSISHDNSPRAILEAYAFGVPVLASSLEGVGEMVKDNVTGRKFETGNASDLASKAHWLVEDNERLKLMGKFARQEYEEKYTAEKNHATLMNIYEQAMAGHGKHLSNIRI